LVIAISLAVSTVAVDWLERLVSKHCLLVH